MKCLKFLVLINFVAFAAAGGGSLCGNIPPDYIALLQAVEDSLNRLIVTVEDTLPTYPANAYSFVTHYHCNWNVSMQMLANGTSHITGVDMDYILGIFNQSITPPFVSPLDCIQNELLAFVAYNANVTQNVLPTWQSMFQNTSISPSTPCSNVSAIGNFYYQGVILFTQRRVNDTLETGIILNNIGKLPLLGAVMDKIFECGSQVVLNSVADILNIQTSQVSAFIQNNSIVVTPPLQCVADIVANVNQTVQGGLNSTNSSLSNPDCGSLPFNFNQLVIAVKDNIDRVLAGIEDVIHTYPALTNSFITHYNCYLNISYNILANGTSQISGVDIDYIRGIFNGTVTAPFIAPLNCIENELLAFNAYVSNISTTVIPAFQALKVSPPVDASTPCVNVTQISNFYYQAVLAFSHQRVNDTLENAAVFTNIGRLDLLLAEIDTMYECAYQIVINGISEVLNIDPSVTVGFLQGSSVSIGQPLSCVENIVTSINNTVRTAVDSSTTSISTNPGLSCDPPFGVFRQFKDAWYNYINQLQVFASNSAFNHSVLTPFYIADFNCQLDIMIILAANATSNMTGVDSEVIYQILTSNVPEPFPSPLDCIAVDLLFMRELISTYKNIIIPGLMNYAVTSTANIATCSSTYAELASYVPLLVQFFYAKEPFIMEATAAFNALGFSDLYLDSFGAVASCTPVNLGHFVGAVLHTNGTPVANFLSGASMTVPYPFSCVRTIINIMNNIYSTALIDFVIGDPLTLTNPTIPPYRG